MSRLETLSSKHMETRAVLQNMQNESESTKKHINTLINKYDLQKDGLIEQDEFIKMMKDSDAKFLLSFFGIILECTMEFFRSPSTAIKPPQPSARSQGRRASMDTTKGLTVSRRHGSLL
jgi:hypothetical protein